MIWVRVLRAAVIGCAMLLFGASGAAAQSARTAPAESPPVPVLIVDMQRIKLESAAGKSVTTQADALRALIEDEISRRESALRAEEQVLADMRETLTSAEFNARVDVFEDQVFTTRQFAQAESAKLQAALRDASAALTASITPVLAQIMRERGAGVMVDKSQTVLSLDALDATDEAIRRIDLVKPTIPLRYRGPMEPPGLGPPEN